MPRQDDVVIANGVGQEVGGLARVGELYDLLRTTEVGLRLVAYELALGNKVSGKVAGNFEDSHRTFLHKASYSYSNARLEMCVEFEARDHVQWYGAVCKQHLSCRRIDTCGVGLETAYAYQ